MTEYVLDFLKAFGGLAFTISILLNIIISILGVVPSVFITAANIKFFGFEQGLMISIAGEALGAIVSFYLYRKGIKKFTDPKKIRNSYLIALHNSKGIKATLLIIALRIFPFVPSGFVTLAGAISKVGIINFSLASTIGKIPSLLIEAYSVQQVLIWNWQGKVIFSMFSLVTVWLLLKKSGKKSFNNKK
ncbi:DedA family protein [Bacillus salacetis]|uniref:TVP38/TMEM64 family membrane protein n=1 Tax=Bacillus salacetis TaxID=2315464 RepID=A0A3A1QUD5_9BACI|nr:VTT domain-containing protein [Bacillus salacetis]RIW28960.1 DedA family protein [Bacillus salacetis]